jgi:hypothetical protein
MLKNQEVNEETQFNRTANCRARGSSVASALQNKARRDARQSKRKAEVNAVLADTATRSAAWDISEVLYDVKTVKVADILARTDSPSEYYLQAVSGFLAQLDQVGAIVLNGEAIFIADYDLLIEVLGRYLDRH